jgi:hypothetical protein
MATMSKVEIDIDAAQPESGTGNAARMVLDTSRSQKRAYHSSSSPNFERPYEKSFKRHRKHLESTNEDTFGILVVHQVDCSNHLPGHEKHNRKLYLDQPRLFAKDTKASALRGRECIESTLEDHIRENSEARLVVLREYNCDEYVDTIDEEFIFLGLPNVDAEAAASLRPYFYVLQDHDAMPARSYVERIQLFNGLSSAMDQLSKAEPLLLSRWRQNLHHPYLQIYHTRDRIQSLTLAVLNEHHQAFVLSLLKYVEETCGANHREADLLFAQGLVTKKHMSKLFGPNEIVITTDGGEPSAYVSESCPLTPDFDDSLVLKCYHWTFDGAFHRENQEISVAWPVKEDRPIPIRDLAVYPLRFDKTEAIKQHLRVRGHMFWSCRKRNFVTSPAESSAFEIRVVLQSFSICKVFSSY